MSEEAILIHAKINHNKKTSKHQDRSGHSNFAGFYIDKRWQVVMSMRLISMRKVR